MASPHLKSKFRPPICVAAPAKACFSVCRICPKAAQVPGAARDALLMRVIGSPDPYGKQIDGMGGATSSTSKTVIISKSSGRTMTWIICSARSRSTRPLSTGAAIAAIFPPRWGRSRSARVWSIRVEIPDNGVAVVRIWQANIGKTIIAHVPITNGAVQETGDFELDGVTFPAAEVQLEFMDPAAEEDGAGGAMFPTGNLVDDLEVPGVGTFKATMINAGIPTIFVDAQAIGYTGTELQDAINSDEKALARFETIRAHGALRMGLIKHLDEIATRQHTPKVAFVAKPADYVASSGKHVAAGDVDLLVRAMSMGKLHHAMMGTAAVAIGTAAAIPARW